MAMLILCFLGFFAAAALLLFASAKSSAEKRVMKMDPNAERRARFKRILADPALQARTTRVSERYREIATEFNAAVHCGDE